MDLELFQSDFVVERDCSFVVERLVDVGSCSLVERELEQERDGIAVVEQLGHCSFVDELVLEQLELLIDDHHLGKLDCSNVRHMSHHRICLRCHMGLCRLDHWLVDIVVEQVVELAEVVLVERLASDHRWLGI